MQDICFHLEFRPMSFSMYIIGLICCERLNVYIIHHIQNIYIFSFRPMSFSMYTTKLHNKSFSKKKKKKLTQ